MEKDVNIEFLKTAIKAVVIAFVFITPLVIMFITKLDNTTSTPIKYINEQKDFIIFFTEKECNNCNSIKKILKNKSVKYIEINKDKNGEYEKILKKLDLNVNTLELPSLVVIKEGKVASYLTGINDENELNSFIEYNETTIE